MVTLQLPPGAAEYPIAHDTVSYVPYRADYTDPASVWLIDVPDHVAVHLLHSGGFSVARKERPATGSGAQPGLVRMRHAEGIGCSFAGRAYEPDADGVVMVPVAAVEDPPAA
jgi:hypothetical protein